MSQLKKMLLSSAMLVLFVTLFCSLAYAGTNKTGTVTASSLNVRSGSGTSFTILARIPNGAKVTILGSTKDWYKVSTSGGTVGWVCSTYVAVSNSAAGNSNVSRGDVSAPQANTSTALSQQVVTYAKKFLGVKYVYGGSTPSGFDCSGFVKYVYNHFGISIERVAANQAQQGTKVSKPDLRAGDLVFFDTDGGHNYINHVGMYIGNGQFIHASSGSSAHRVVISDLTKGFYADAFMTAKRFF